MTITRNIRGRITLIVILLSFIFLSHTPQREKEDPIHYIPVLCYHGFQDTIDTTRGRLTETYSRFERLLKFLSNNGYSTIFPDEINDTNRIHNKVVVITFDDGVKSQMRAARLMEKYGFRGLFFVVPDWLKRGDDNFFSDTDIKDLQKAGHRIAPHGFSHRSMVDDEDEYYFSMSKSSEYLQKILGEEYMIHDFAFPYGHYNFNINKNLANKYRFLHTVNPGYWNGRSTLIPRMLITSDKAMNYYKEYILSANEFNPTIKLITKDGIITNFVEFTAPLDFQTMEIELLTVSPDVHGYTYRSYPIGDNLDREKEVWTIDLKSHIRTFYAPGRRVLSYAIVHRQNDSIDYLSNGYLHWLDE